MNCFPMMMPLKNKRVLLVGGGKIALRKAEKLRLFGAKIAVCAPVVLPALSAMAAEKHAAYDKELLRGAVCAVAATDDAAVNARVAEDCRAAGVPVNSVDAPSDCDFYFPALVTRGDVTVGVSTGGASPALCAALAKRLETLLPQSLSQVCERAEELRGRLHGEEYLAAVEQLLKEAGL